MAESQNAEAKLEEVFCAVIELPPGTEVREFRAGVTAAWDSLATVSLVAAIESEFGLSLDAGEMLRLTSFEEALKLVRDLAS